MKLSTHLWHQLINGCVVMQVFGEVFVQTGSRQRGKQDDPQQHCHCAGTQPAVGQDGGVSVRGCRLWVLRTSPHSASHF